jgi:uncharacterized protein (TIGR02599 family)
MNAPFNSMSSHKTFQHGESGRASPSAAFSLIELLISLAVLSVLVVLAASLIGAIQDVWKRSSARTEQFRSARQALETISSRLSQATLNPYWVVQTNSSGVRYERQSDLRFLTGQAPTLTALAQPGGALFFQAPTGYSANSTSRLDAALNTWGYFVEYGSDAGFRPAFLTTAGLPARNRFRLMEFLDPSDELQVFKNTSGNSTYTGREWFSTPLTKLKTDGTPKNRRVLAENIVAVVVLPRLSSMEDSSVGQVDLSPQFSYDSTSTNAVPITDSRNKLVQHIIRHQLPPIVDIAVVAIDEQSARRITWGSSPPVFGTNLFQNSANMDADLEELRKNITAQGLSARVFRTSVPISAARWSTEQKN